VKNTLKSNMYAQVAAGIWDLFGEHLSGSCDTLICVTSFTPLGNTAQNALNSSFERLGYGQNACTFLVITKDSETLGAKELFCVVEGLDPLIHLVADVKARSALEEAFQQAIPPMLPCRVLGLETRAFQSFEDMLQTDKGKQAAWTFLKSVPRRA
jgi:hypothetical protein